MFMKKILLLITFSICLVKSSNAEIYKLGKLKIDLFDPNKLIKTTGVINESFGIAKIKIFAEKTSDNKITSMITTVKWKGDKFSSDMRAYWIDYFFKSKKGIFNKNEVTNLKIVNENFTNGLVIQELNLKDYLKQQDEFREFKAAIKKLKKNYGVDLPERVIRADHIYIKGGDLFWVGYMFNYNQIISENVFVDKFTKFNPNIIDNYPDYKNKMSRWINLALKRHQEFQDTFKIKKKINLTYENFDIKKELNYYEELFYSTEFKPEQKLKIEDKEKAKEEKAKKAAEQKAKEEKAKKVLKEKVIDQEALSVEDIMTKIKDLNEMYKSGLISKEEFELLKSKLLKN